MDNNKKASIKKHYSVKLKERIAELERDLYAIIDGNEEVKVKYLLIRKINTDFEKMVWMGSPTINKQFNGIFKCIINGNK